MYFTISTVPGVKDSIVRCQRRSFVLFTFYSLLFSFTFFILKTTLLAKWNLDPRVIHFIPLSFFVSICKWQAVFDREARSLSNGSGSGDGKATSI